MPKLSDETMKERRTVILKAAARCFRKRGFHATTILDICRDAEVSTGAVYTHFRNKQEIIDELGTDALAEFAGTITTAPSTQSAVTVLSQLLRRLLTSRQGLADAELDLNLWAESIGDAALRRTCQRSMRNLEQGFVTMVREQRKDLDSGASGIAQILHAAAIGFEVQRALGLKKNLKEIELALAAILSPASAE